MVAIYRAGSAVSRYRWLLYELLLRDLKLRYRGSALGFAWTILNPVLFMLVYTLVFSVFLRVGVRDFPIYLLTGIIAYNWFSVAISSSLTAIPDGRMYVGQTIFPIEMLVFVPVLSNGINFVLSLVLLMPFAFYFGHAGWGVLALPLLIAIELCMTLGLAFIGATFNVFFRDLQQLVGYVLSALFFLTPIFYSRRSVPANLQFIVTFNPVAALIDGYQRVLYYGGLPGLRTTLFAALFGAIILGVGVACFDRYREVFSEYI
jgi:lipopolysaccharide transport system permease protein